MKKVFIISWVLSANFVFAQSFEPQTLQTLGNCLETKVSLFQGNSLSSETTKTYDANGNLTKKTDVFSQNPNGAYTTATTYEYDAAGNNTKVVSVQNGYQKSVISKVYSAGKLVQETLLSGGNTTLATAATTTNTTGNVVVKAFPDGISKETKQFDKSGNLLKQENIGSDGKLFSSITSEYNFQGKLTKTTKLDVPSGISEVTNFTYDANGNLLDIKVLRNKTTFAETVFAYNSQGQLTTKTHSNSTLSVDYYYTFDYNSAGKTAKQSYFAGSQLISQTTYEYDAAGNKTKETFLDANNAPTGYRTWEYSCK